jgi:hypothetical protein
VLLAGCSAASGKSGGDAGVHGATGDGGSGTVDAGQLDSSSGGGGSDEGGGGLEAAPPDVACTGASPASTYDALGSGTAASPYLLCNLPQLISLAAAPAAWKYAYRLGADLDLTGSASFTGIGNTQHPFNGTFQGGGHIVSNLSLASPTASDVGFFGVVLGGATVVSGVHLVGASVIGATNVGLLVGRCDDGARVLGSSSQGAVKGTVSVGGLVGSGTNGPVISSSWSSATVTSTGSAGGLVGGLSQGAFIFNSYATGPVTGESSTGGLVGSIDSGGVYDSYATGDVTSTAASVDGVGGFVGAVHGTIYQNCLSIGDVTASTSTSTVGRFAGDAPYGTFTNDHDLSTSACQVRSGTACVDDGMGEPLSQLQDPAGSTLSKWDLAHTWVTASGALPTLDSALFDPSAWDGCAAHATDAPFAGGDGTPDRPFLLCSPTQFAALAGNDAVWAGAYVLQMSPIDLSTTQLTPIGDLGNLFVGVYNGNGNTLSNFSVSANTYAVGLFGSMTGTILRVGAVNGKVVGGGSATATGMLAGNLYGTLLDSYATGGTVTGPTSVGAIGNAHTTIDCYASVAVTATGGQAGGLNAAGGNDGLVVDVFASSSVTASPAFFVTPTVNGSSQVIDAYYDTTKTCAGCQAVFATGETTGYFYVPTHAPMSNWDFDTIWTAQTGGFPVLR